MSPQKLMITPKKYVLIVLLLITVITGVNSADQQGLLNAGIAMFTAVCLDGLLALFEGRERVTFDGGIITGLIIALVLSSSVTWYLTAATTVIAIISKHLFRIKNRPVFNPAAFGLLIAILLFSSGQSWWGAFSELPTWSILFLLIGGYLVTERVNKFPQVFSYLGIYFTLLLIMGLFNMGQAADAFRTPFTNSALFLALIMLTDPPTSPGKSSDQVWFGGIAAAVTVGIYAIFGGLTYLLIGLLTANVWNALRILRPSQTSELCKGGS